MRNDIVQSMEQPPDFTGVTPDMNKNDSRLRTGRYDAPEEDEDGYVQLSDEDLIPAEDEPSVQTGYVKREPPSPPRPKDARESAATDPEVDPVLAAKKKGGGGEGGGKKKGKGKKGGGSGDKKGDEQAWNNVESVQREMGTWSREKDELDALIREQKITEGVTGANAQEKGKKSIELEKLELQKERLEKRIAKGRAKLAIEEKRKEYHRYEQQLIDVNGKIKQIKEDPPANLIAERDQVSLLMNRSHEELMEMSSAYMKEYAGVTFDDTAMYEPLPTIHVHVSKNEDEERTTVGKAVIGTAVIGGTTVGSMLAIAGGSLKELWKSWRAHVKNPNKLFGGRDWKDFFWPPDKKKK